MAKQRKKRAKKSQKKSLFSFKFILVFTLIFSIIPIGVGVYLFKTGKIAFVQDKKKSIKDKDILQKMQNTLNKKEQDILNLAQKQKEQKEQTLKHQKISYKTINDALEELKKKQYKKQPHENNKSKNSEIKKNNAKKEGKKKKVSKKEKVVLKIKPPLHVNKKPSYKGMPRLAIIIDDVSFKNQVRHIKMIPFKVTPSFFPPTSLHPDSAKIAQDFKVYMVHFPLEAKRFKRQEERTLMVGESYESILSWVKKVKKWFPKAKYYNNHTGSKFTSDLVSMDRLFRALMAENLIFVDSKTSVHSKGEIIAKKYKKRLLKRDVFLDNTRTVPYITKQLKQSIKIAKRRGYAIAIGHPYPETLKVLKNAKPLLKGIKLVYINEL